MGGVESGSFGALLKRHRRRARLTQEELAERAGLSVRGLKYLEQGARQPYRDTVRRLVAALALAGAEEAAFEVAARLPGPTEAAGPSTPAPRHNLPEDLSSFVGREAEQAQVRVLLATHRLVTLCGSGGAGKTRLALAVAGALVDGYADGIWLVELAALADPGLLASTLAATLGLREEPGRVLPVTLSEHLRDKQTLLVLDNCEHLLDACAQLSEALLGTCPRLHILATSREGLAVAGEALYRVPSLPVPDLARLLPAARLADYAAVRLFVERAQARQAGFELSEQHARLVAQICVRLDGIPLAIELAAARVGSTPLAVLAARLDQSLRLLTGGARTASPRQQTLRGALDWSWELLVERERILLRRLAVFAGGCTLMAAEAVCAGEEIEEWEVVDLLAALVNKSLALLAERAGEEARYRLLEPVRQYAQERLEAAGEEAVLRERHLAWCLALAEQASSQLTGAAQGAWLAQLEREHDNLRAAQRWSLREGGSVQAAVQLAGALWRFWSMRGHLGEGRGWLEAALARDEATGVPAALRARALNGAGNLADSQGDHAGAAKLYEEGLALRRELGDTRGIASSLNNLGNVAYAQGDYPRAAALYEESLTLIRELGDTWGIAASLNNLGNVADAQGDYPRAVALHEESLALKRELGDKRGIAASLDNLGNAASAQGDYTRAAALHEESLALERELGDTWGIAYSLGTLGNVAYAQGDYTRAAALHEESLALKRELGAMGGIAGELEGFALLAGAQGRPRRAVQLWAAADALRGALGAPRDQHDRAQYEQAVAVQREALGEEAFAAAWTAGAALALEEAVALALEDQASTG